MNYQFPFLVVEGLSGTGKSTIANLVAKSLGGVVYHTPPEPFAALRDTIDRTWSLPSRYLFYLAGVARASDEIRNLRKGAPVICDRYLLTTQCWHEVVGVPVADSPIRRFDILMPDLTVLITCIEKERQVRLDGRGRSFNDVQEQKDGLERRFLEAYRQYHPDEVDNSGRDPQIAANQILDLLASIDDACFQRTSQPVSGLTTSVERPMNLNGAWVEGSASKLIAPVYGKTPIQI